MKVEIAKIISNGCGIGWADGETYFVPYTIAGDVVEPLAFIKEKSHKIVTDFRLEKRSVFRREPFCRHFGNCGGCLFQHIAYTEQLRIKKDIFRELFRQSGIRPDAEIEVFTTGEFGMRTRTKIFARDGKACYRSKKSQNLIPIDVCPILHPIFMDKIREDVAKRSGDIQYEYSAVTGDFMPGGEFVRKIVNGKTLKIYENSFFQPSEAAAGLMCCKLSEILDELHPKSACDLFCGCGLFSATLVERRVRTSGVEIVENACRSFSENLGGSAKIIKMDAYKLNALKRVDLIVADPPRNGLGTRLSELVCRSTDNVVYIACEPPNFVRDLHVFMNNGFKVRRLFLFDIFPDTPHFESCCWLARD